MATPVANATKAWWASEPHRLSDYKSAEQVPETADIVIIGSGIAGTSVAYHILHQTQTKRDEQPSIAILEARQACSGATGRNGGHLRPDPYSQLYENALRHGVEAATEVGKFEAAHLEAVGRVIKDEGINCEFEVTTSMDVQMSAETGTAAVNALEKLRLLGAQLPQKVNRNDAEQAANVSGVKNARGCLSFEAGHLWPYKLVLALLSRCVERGAHLFTHTPVLSVASERDTSARFEVKTSGGIIHARQVVFATNAYTASLLPMYANSVVPIRGVCCRIVPKQPPKEKLDKTYIIRWSKDAFDYLIPRKDGSIIVGGDLARHPRESWFNVSNDDEIIDSVRQYFTGYMQRNFRGWQDTGAYIDQIWSGIMGFTGDSLPHVGHVPDRPGQLIIAGFNGHGMPQAFLAGKELADMIVKGISFEETATPKVFKTTAERLRKEKGKGKGEILGVRLDETPTSHL